MDPTTTQFRTLQQLNGEATNLGMDNQEAGRYVEVELEAMEAAGLQAEADAINREAADL